MNLPRIPKSCAQKRYEQLCQEGKARLEAIREVEREYAMADTEPQGLDKIFLDHERPLAKWAAEHPAQIRP